MYIKKPFRYSSMSIMKNPGISIIIPVFNRGELLFETLNSLRDQSYSNWEAILVDDGSDDKTVEIISKALQEEPRFRYLKRDISSSEKSGAAVCRNIGLEIADGEYVIFLDSDDLLTRKALANRIKLMDDNPELDFGVFQCLLFEKEPGDLDSLWNIATEEDDIDRFLTQDIPWQTTGPIWRKKALQRLGCWQDSLPSWQDFEFHLRALISGFSYKTFGIVDYYWRLPITNPNSIGNNSKSPEHLRSHAELVFDLKKQLINAQKLNRKHQESLAILCFFIMKLWTYQGSNFQKDAFEAWHNFYTEELIDFSMFISGFIYMKIINLFSVRSIPWRIVHRIFLEYVEVINFSRRFTLKASKTYRKISYSSFCELNTNHVNY